MIFYCVKSILEGGGVAFPVPVPRVVVFTNTMGRQFTVTRPTITDLDGHGYFKGNRFPADQPADLKPGEKYGDTVLVDGRGVVQVVPFTEAEQAAARLELCHQIQAAAGKSNGRKFTAGTKPQRDSVTNAATLAEAEDLARLAIAELSEA